MHYIGCDCDTWAGLYMLCTGQWIAGFNEFIPNSVVRLQLCPSRDELQKLAWGLARIAAPDGWDTSIVLVY